MDAYRHFVNQYEDALSSVLPAPNPDEFPKPPPPGPDAPVALLFSPHPDDEVITGTLPLRLQHEAGARIVNIAVTLGSNPQRRAARVRELETACALLGWELEIHGWTGLTAEAVDSTEPNPQNWLGSVVEILQRWQPRWIFYPHADDWHPTHRAVNRLIEAALKHVSLPAAPFRMQTEYWHPLAQPNLLVECPPDHVALLIAALCCHQGEIARNPYHLTLPAWMADNVRRGAEIVVGPGQPAPEFKFGVLYRVEPGLPKGWDAVLAAKKSTIK